MELYFMKDEYSLEFAKAYNIDWHYFSQRLANKILEIIPNKDSLLDLGCGTGNFLALLENDFKRCVGIDISSGMIEIAKQNCKKSELMIGNVLDFNFPEKFSLITCNFDMVNHLDNLDEWTKVFLNAYNHLKVDGYFIFDFNTLVSYTYLNIDEEFNYATDNFKYIAKNYIVDKNHARLTIKVFDKDNNFLSSIDQTESFYSPEEVSLKLKEVGFKEFHFFNKNFEPTLDYDTKRLFVVCKK